MGIKSRVGIIAITAIMCTLVVLSTVFPFPEGSRWDLLSIGTIQKVLASPDWYDSSWAYRKSVTVTNASADYQTLIFVGESSGSSSYNVTCEGHCQSDFDDLRFTGSDKVTLLDYWIRNISGTSPNQTAAVLVQNDGTPSTSCYMYYGNPDTTVYSNGNNTFPFFDDFTGISGFDASNGAISTQIDPPEYGMTGSFITLNSTDGLLFWRSGSIHDYSANGRLIETAYNLSTKAWGANTTVYNSTYDDRNPAGGLIDSTIFIFFGRYAGVGSWYDMGYIKSTDWGANWNDYTAINVSPCTWYSPTGHIISTGVSGTYLMPWYGGYAGGNYKVGTFKTTDSGATWSIGPYIYEGTTALTECSIEYIGNNKLIAIIRQDSATAVWQSTSEDNGATWTAPATSSFSKALAGHMTYYDVSDDLIVLVWTHATSYQVGFAIADASDLYGDKDAWYDSTSLESSGVNYINMGIVEKIGTRTYFALWTDPQLDGSTRFRGCNITTVPATAIDADKWQVMTGNTPTISGGVLTVDNGWIWNYNTYGQNYTLGAKVKMSATTVAQEWGFSSQTVVGASNDIANSAYAYAAGYWHTSVVYYIQNRETAQTQVSGGAYNTDWHIMEIIRNGSTNVQYTKDGAQVSNSPITTNIPSTAGYIHLLDYANTAGNAQYDWLYIRKWTATEPTWGSWGSEEPLTAEITNTPSSKDFGILEVNTTNNTDINYFTLNNTGNCHVSVTIQGTNATGGDDTWVLSNNAIPGVNTYGLYAGLDDADDLFDTVVNSTANVLVSDLAEGVTQGWGLNVSMPTSVTGYDGQAMNATITLVASAA